MAHRTQAGSFGSFSDMPGSFRTRVFAREYFYRAQPPVPAGTILDDLLTGTERSTRARGITAVQPAPRAHASSSG